MTMANVAWGVVAVLFSGIAAAGQAQSVEDDSPMNPASAVVYFEVGSDTLGPEAIETISDSVASAKQRGAAVGLAYIQGYSDFFAEKGSELGMRRAEVVAHELAALLGPEVSIEVHASEGGPAIDCSRLRDEPTRLRCSESSRRVFAVLISR